ncbi:MAG: hypothetical protein AAFN27_16250 [Pseudomonadota bacterium]
MHWPDLDIRDNDERMVPADASNDLDIVIGFAVRQAHILVQVEVQNDGLVLAIPNAVARNVLNGLRGAREMGVAAPVTIDRVPGFFFAGTVADPMKRIVRTLDVATFEKQ